MILCGHGDDDPAILQRARDFFMKLGFLRVQFTTPKTHDEMIAVYVAAGACRVERVCEVPAGG